MKAACESRCLAVTSRELAAVDRRHRHRSPCPCEGGRAHLPAGAHRLPSCVRIDVSRPVRAPVSSASRGSLMPPPIAILTLAMIWLAGIGFFAFTMKDQAPMNPARLSRVRQLASDASVHLGIGDVSCFESAAGVQPEIAGAVDQRLRPSRACPRRMAIRHAHRMRQNPRRQRTGESRKQIDDPRRNATAGRSTIVGSTALLDRQWRPGGRRSSSIGMQWPASSPCARVRCSVTGSFGACRRGRSSDHGARSSACIRIVGTEHDSVCPVT